MEFLLAVSRRNSRRIRIEQLLLLGLRAAIIAVAGMAIARPMLASSPASGILGQSHGHYVLVIDDSLSMRMSDGLGGAVFHKAKASALKLLKRLNSTDAISVVLTSRPASALIETPSYSHDQAAQSIEQLSASCAETDMAGAMTLATQILEASPAGPGARYLYVITDGTRSCWTDESGLEAALPEACRKAADLAQMALIDLGPNDRGNVAVHNVRAASKAVGVGLEATFQVDVWNFSPVERRGLSLRIIRDETLAQTPDVPPLPPRGMRTIPFNLQFDQVGEHSVTVEVESANDVLGKDDRSYLTLSATRNLNVLMVDGRPGGSAATSSTYFVKTALAPETPDGPANLISTRTILPGELDSEELSEFSVIILSDVRGLGGNGWSALEKFVDAGGGLIAFLGPQSDIEEFNRHGFADGKGLAPARLAGIVSTEDDERSKISPEGLYHPVVLEFKSKPGDILFNALFTGYVQARIPESRGDAATALSFVGGDPMLILTSYGKGTVAIVATAADMVWSNLPAKPVFVPFCLQLVLHTAPDLSSGRNVRVRDEMIAPLTPLESSKAIKGVGPNRLKLKTRLDPGEDQYLARCADTETPGIYRLEIGNRRAEFAVNLPSVESNLRSISEQDLRDVLEDVDFRYARTVDESGKTRIDAPSREFSGGLLACVVGLLLLEMLLAQRFGRAAPRQKGPNR
jgi:hypothetical protein